jgi:hypothetical protein
MNNRRGSLRLGDVAFARSGDKGSSANVAVFARDPETYPFLVRCLTADVVARYFRPLGIQSVARYEVPNIEALNFVLTGVLGKGGSRSLRVDSQGKALGQAILELEFSDTDET